MLHGACLGVRSTCTMFHDAVMSGQVVDDEDMLMHIFGFRLDLPGSKAVKPAQEALEKGVQVATNQGEQGAALLSRLKFRLTHVQILQNMYPATESSISAVPNLCETACSLLDNFLTSALSEETLAAAPGFAPEVHRRAMGLAPPRAINITPFDKTVEHWKSILGALRDACQWLIKCTSWRELRDQLIQFAAAPLNMPLVRSIVHRAIVSPLRGAPSPQVPNATTSSATAQQTTTTIPKWCPSQAMIAAEFGWPTDAPPGGEAAIFLEQCAIAVQGWCHTMCLNRCRQRRRLRRLLEDWHNMTDHAFNAEASEDLQVWFTKQGWKWQASDKDGYPVPGPVSAWVESMSSWTMAAHLSLGMQLDIYAPHEYCSVYWYCDYLLGSMQGAVAELENMKPAKVAGKKGGKSGGKSAKKPATGVQEVGMEERLAVDAMVGKADRMMCQAFMRVTLGLAWLGLVSSPPAPFNSERERFQQRFGAFEQLVRPTALTYDDFKRSTAPGDITPPRVLLAAYEAFATAQNTINTIEGSANLVRALTPQQANHIAGVKRISKQNLMAVKLLINSITGLAATEKPPFTVGWDFKTALQHSTTLYFPALVLKSAKK